jgi:hypothetical protein
MKTFLNSRNILAVASIIIITSCASTNSIETPERQAAVDNAINSKDFTVAVEVMEPRVTVAVQNVTNELLRNTGNTGNRVSIIGDGHTIRFHNDSIVTSLPYIGERQMGGGYNNTDTGIILDGPITNYQEKTDSKKGETIITMDTMNGTESYRVQLIVQQYGYTYVNISSSQRNSIAYTGKLVFIEE